MLPLLNIKGILFACCTLTIGGWITDHLYTVSGISFMIPKSIGWMDKLPQRPPVQIY